MEFEEFKYTTENVQVVLFPKYWANFSLQLVKLKISN
jgi:hypothetical protein